MPVSAQLPAAVEPPFLAVPEREVRIGIIGLGSMGRGLVYQARLTPGVRCVAVAEVQVQRAAADLESLGAPFEAVDDARGVERVSARGGLALTTDGMQVCDCPAVDVVVEASNTVLDGGRYAFRALARGKHLVLMNAEVDLLFGPALMITARENGVVYSGIDGDQYGVLKRMIDEIRFWGFELVTAGNIKGYLDRYANPTTIVPEARKRNLDPRMAASYTDGTKLNIEMALIANALGLRTPSVGMSGPRARHVCELFGLIDVSAIHRRLGGFVDYVLGAEPGGGVFVVGYCDHPYQRAMLDYYKMGPGPYYLFVRPMHLCHIEAMRTVLEVAVHHRPLLQPWAGSPTDVFAFAKRALRRGERLDGVGGYTCYGLIDNCYQGHAHPGLPILLADDVVVTRDIDMDEPVLLTDIERPDERLDFAAFRSQRAITA